MERFHFLLEPFTREIKVEHRLKVHAIEAQVGLLRQTVEQRQSSALVAPAGAGKTFALRSLRACLPEARYRVTYIKLGDISPHDMAREIASRLFTASYGPLPRILRSIEERLRSGYLDQGIRQVIIFDDAHEIRLESLKLLRLLTNFEMDSKLVVSVILAGQRPLKTLLLQEGVEDVYQRLAQTSELSLLTREESTAYIEHRCKIAGLSQTPFDPQAMDAIFEIARGNMRAIDKIARASLKVANDAARGCVDAADVAIARTQTWM